jgi:hypothetical protein
MDGQGLLQALRDTGGPLQGAQALLFPAVEDLQQALVEKHKRKAQPLQAVVA